MEKTISKFRLTVIFALTLLFSLAIGASAFKADLAYGDTDLRGWRVASPHRINNYDRTGVMIDTPSEENNNGIIENYIRADYVYTSNLETGLEFSYMLPDEEAFTVGEEVYVFEHPTAPTIVDKGAIINDARYYDHSYVKFTVEGAGGNGFEAVFYHQYADDNASYPNRIFVNLYYTSSSIRADGSDSKVNGRHYVETVFSYQPNYGVWHTLSCCKANGWLLIAADGTNFVPVAEYGSFDLSGARVKVEAKSIVTPKMSIALRTPESSFDKSVYGTWMTLGESNVTREYDGTYRMEVAEHNDLLPWTAASTGSMLMRERVFSTKGYSVDEPIVIDCSLDGNGPQNYLAIKLGRSPLDAVTPLRYDRMGTGNIVRESPFEDEMELAYSESGSSLFIGKNAIGARVDVDDGPYTTDYVVRWAITSKNVESYEGYNTIDKITFIVNDNGTDVYMNNVYAYTFRNMPRSFYAESGYMAYPYFAFSEYPRQPDRNNVIHIRGVNAPYDGGLPVKKYMSSEGDLDITLDSYGEEISLYLDKDLRQPVNPADYSYNGEDGVLTLKTSFFAGKTYGLNEFFVASENGVCYMRVRYFPENYVENVPTIVASQKDDMGTPTVVFDRKTIVSYQINEEERIVHSIVTDDSGSDLRVKLSLYANKFVKVYGWGITDAEYMYNERQGTLLIRNSFLSEHANGTYTLFLVTEDEDGISRETKFNVEIVNYSPFEVTITETVSSGCGGAAESQGAIILALAIFAVAAKALITRKSKNNI